MISDALKIPYAGDGNKIALFGGSFNPPHEGHLNVSELALQRLGVDQVWWIVTPGNPLKDHSELASLEDRIELCNELASHPKIKVTAFEARYRVRYTADTLRLLKRIRPRLNFVWLMGADNLAQFHKWQDWREIAEMMPLAIVDRPGSTLSYRSARAALTLWRYRHDEGDASLLADMEPPAWTFIHGPRSSLSSTQLRAARKKITGGKSPS